jgi:hypothetical protein
MSERLPSGLLVSAMLRRCNDAGGFGVVLARGDAQAGGILIVVAAPGEPERGLERGLGPRGEPVLIDSTPTATNAGTDDGVGGYWLRRRSRDPDLWVIELGVANAERLVAETLLAV